MESFPLKAKHKVNSQSDSGISRMRAPVVVRARPISRLARKAPGPLSTSSTEYISPSTSFWPS
ncbi:hypothetical protein E2C01_032832 [Portunus trituberculatus]|uniref:Uncharacterized protein n=1 Tax=Portunus trituberculatus TaxID=210409 RepID=A0A5B7EWY1_PORTR|nr:hypothetical protein [Portunus trituberculatus]